jgi:hypothetical protein
MKRFRIFLLLSLAATLLLITSQVFASPSTIPANNTKDPKTPGAQATNKADEKATKEAGEPPKGKHENFKGTVSAADASSITLTLRDGSSVTIGISTDTRLKFPGKKDSAPTSIQAGMNAMVQAIRDESNNLVARAIMVIPGKPTKIHRVGTVTAYEAGKSITIQDKDGNSFEFSLNAETKVLPVDRAGGLTVGSRVTVIAPRDPASGGVTVIGIVIHPATP